jgi:hypothetical protein
MLSTANFFWNGNFSLYEYACVASFVKNNFKVNVFTFDRNLNLPSGAILRDAGEILPKSELHAYTLSGIKGCMAGFADAFRLHLLKKAGGWWFDADVMCLRDVTAFRQLVTNKPVPISAGFQNRKYVSNAVLYADDSHFVDALLTQLKKNGKDVIWGKNGPELTTKIMTDLGYLNYADPVSTFYPFDGHDLFKIFEPDYKDWCESAFGQSLTMHLWNDMLRHLCFPKNILPPDDSYALAMFIAYCPELEHVPKIPLVTARSLFDHLRLKKITQSKTISSAIALRKFVKNGLKRIKL